MKKIILSAALIATGIFATAQKNTILVAGEVGYSDTEINNADGSTLTLNPKIGYQFTDHLTLGAEWSYKESDGTVSNNTVNADAYEQNQKIGGFLRYSMPLNNTFSVFADLGVGYQYLANDLAGIEQYSADGLYTDLVPALFINMRNGFGLNFNIGGIEYSNLSGTNYDADNFNFNFGKEVGFGISKNFGAGKKASN
ncbi:hypothetical protein UJ101_02115 [Flavobacteriaceae bacterium UJ101]|nr:hypothetical protein UJ101_02115 [Flavobacteriaceae bacterium UJ101]